MTRRARIYQPPKTAMQSGQASTHDWVLEFEPAEPPHHDPLMGWISSADTETQLRLRFPTREATMAYAARHALAYDLELPARPRFRPKVYAENFQYRRRENWTH